MRMNRYMQETLRASFAAALFVGAGTISFADAPVANVVVYDSSVTDDPSPRVVDSRLVEGYTTSVGAYDGFNVEVGRLDPDPSAGFLAFGPLDVDIPLPLPATQYHVYGNQRSATKATAYFGDAGVYDPLRVEVNPPGGFYETTVNLSFHAPEAGIAITYSVNGSPPMIYAGESIHIAKDSIVSYRGNDGMIMGTAKIATYLFGGPVCVDTDQDNIPDRIEIELGLDPLRAEGDFNGNTLDDLDEFLRGTDAFIPNDPDDLPPGWVDPDNDSWSTEDENLRGTDANDPDSFPAAPNLKTVEIFRSGEIQETTAGASPPPLTPDPELPWPTTFRVDVLTPGGEALSHRLETDDGTFSYRTSGEQFHYIRARAQDGSGRVLLGLEQPQSLRIDPIIDLCSDAFDLEDWRDAYRAIYDARIFDTSAGEVLNARTTAEALLLNLYYEQLTGEEFTPGTPGAGPEASIVFDLRATMNEAEIYDLISSSVTVPMLDLVSDYLRFSTTPGRVSMLELLADHFAGRSVDPMLIPDGVRVGNLPLVATSAAAFAAAIPPAITTLEGPLTIDEFGFLLQQDATTYRLSGLMGAYIPGTIITVEGLVDVDNHDSDPLPVRIANVVGYQLPPVPPAVDSDMDMLDDDWEFFYFGGLDQDANGDFDNDGILNIDEQDQGSNPVQADAPTSDFESWVIF